MLSWFVLNKTLYVKITLPVLCLILTACSQSFAQTITGAWKGKINNTKVELKLAIV